MEMNGKNELEHRQIQYIRVLIFHILVDDLGFYFHFANSYLNRNFILDVIVR